jgi:hypothetical protein
MGWVSGEEFGSAAVDSIVAHGFDILSHMNTDHREALVDLVAKETGQRLAPAVVLMTDINANEFEISARGNTFERVVCKFKTPVTNPKEARAAIITLVQEAKTVLL